VETLIFWEAFALESKQSTKGSDAGSANVCETKERRKRERTARELIVLDSADDDERHRQWVCDSGIGGNNPPRGCTDLGRLHHCINKNKHVIFRTFRFPTRRVSRTRRSTFSQSTEY
jgi:hypothetical protein